MKKTFPAIKIKMGSWNYYSIRMNLKEASENIIMANSFNKPSLLDDLLQRQFNESRLKPMANYLAKRNDRFYASLVVAALDGDPEWHHAPEDPKFLKDHGLKKSEDRLGYVSLDFGSEANPKRFFVLDGQHRLMSISHVIKEELAEDMNAFEEEQISVLIVAKQDAVTKDAQIRYRRLFTSLNRWAKPTDDTTNIIMEEDDAIALITRRLVETHTAFETPAGKTARENPNLNVNSKNLQDGVPYLTSLVTLYNMNKKFLENCDFPELNPADRDALLVRPVQEEMDNYFADVEAIWNAIFLILPELLGDRSKMRAHDAELSNNDYSDHPFLWPIIQQNVFAPIVRRLLDDQEMQDETYENRLAPLSKLKLDLRLAPAVHLVLVKNDYSDPTSDFIMAAGDDKKQRNTIYKELLYFICDIGTWEDQDIAEQRAKAFAFLHSSLTNEEKNQWWDEVINQKS
jgi:DNA sulfur modification protein DndB